MPYYYIKAHITPMGDYQDPMEDGGELVREIDTKALVEAVEEKTGKVCCLSPAWGVVKLGRVWETWELFAEDNGFLIQDFLN